MAAIRASRSHVAAEGSKVTPSSFVARSSADIEADVAVKLRRRALHHRSLGMHLEGLGGGLVDLLPGAALAVVTAAGWLVARWLSERVAIVV